MVCMHSTFFFFPRWVNFCTEISPIIGVSQTLAWVLPEYNILRIRDYLQCVLRLFTWLKVLDSRRAILMFVFPFATEFSQLTKTQTGLSTSILQIFFEYIFVHWVCAQASSCRVSVVLRMAAYLVSRGCVGEALALGFLLVVWSYSFSEDFLSAFYSNREWDTNILAPYVNFTSNCDSVV